MSDAERWAEIEDLSRAFFQWLRGDGLIGVSGHDRASLLRVDGLGRGAELIHHTGTGLGFYLPPIAAQSRHVVAGDAVADLIGARAAENLSRSATSDKPRDPRFFASIDGGLIRVGAWDPNVARPVDLPALGTSAHLFLFDAPPACWSPETCQGMNAHVLAYMLMSGVPGAYVAPGGPWISTKDLTGQSGVDMVLASHPGLDEDMQVVWPITVLDGRHGPIQMELGTLRTFLAFASYRLAKVGTGLGAMRKAAALTRGHQKTGEILTTALATMTWRVLREQIESVPPADRVVGWSIVPPRLRGSASEIQQLYARATTVAHEEDRLVWTFGGTSATEDVDDTSIPELSREGGGDEKPAELERPVEPAKAPAAPTRGWDSPPTSRLPEALYQRLGSTRPEGNQAVWGEQDSQARVEIANLLGVGEWRVLPWRAQLRRLAVALRDYKMGVSWRRGDWYTVQTLAGIVAITPQGDADAWAVLERLAAVHNMTPTDLGRGLTTAHARACGPNAPGMARLPGDVVLQGGVGGQLWRAHVVTTGQDVPLFTVMRVDGKWSGAWTSEVQVALGVRAKPITGSWTSSNITKHGREKPTNAVGLLHDAIRALGCDFPAGTRVGVISANGVQALPDTEMVAWYVRGAAPPDWSAFGVAAATTVAVAAGLSPQDPQLLAMLGPVNLVDVPVEAPTVAEASEVAATTVPVEPVQADAAQPSEVPQALPADYPVDALVEEQFRTVKPVRLSDPGLSDAERQDVVRRLHRARSGDLTVIGRKGWARSMGEQSALRAEVRRLNRLLQGQTYTMAKDVVAYLSRRVSGGTTGGGAWVPELMRAIIEQIPGWTLMESLVLRGARLPKSGVTAEQARDALESMLRDHMRPLGNARSNLRPVQVDFYEQWLQVDLMPRFEVVHVGDTPQPPQPQIRDVIRDVLVPLPAHWAAQGLELSPPETVDADRIYVGTPNGALPDTSGSSVRFTFWDKRRPQDTFAVLYLPTRQWTIANEKGESAVIEVPVYREEDGAYPVSHPTWKKLYDIGFWEAARDLLPKAKETLESFGKSGQAGRISICPVCFGRWATTASGYMSLHDYRRPGWGYVVGPCLGHHYRPWQVSPEGTQFVHQEHVQLAATYTLDHEAHLAGGRTYTTFVQVLEAGQPVPETDPQRRALYGPTKVKLVTVPPGHPWWERVRNRYAEAALERVQAATETAYQYAHLAGLWPKAPGEYPATWEATPEERAAVDVEIQAAISEKRQRGSTYTDAGAQVGNVPERLAEPAQAPEPAMAEPTLIPTSAPVLEGEAARIQAHLRREQPSPAMQKLLAMSDDAIAEELNKIAAAAGDKKLANAFTPSIVQAAFRTNPYNTLSFLLGTTEGTDHLRELLRQHNVVKVSKVPGMRRSGPVLKALGLPMELPEYHGHTAQDLLDLGPVGLELVQAFAAVSSLEHMTLAYAATTTSAKHFYNRLTDGTPRDLERLLDLAGDTGAVQVFARAMLAYLSGVPPAQTEAEWRAQVFAFVERDGAEYEAELEREKRQAESDKAARAAKREIDEQLRKLDLSFQEVPEEFFAFMRETKPKGQTLAALGKRRYQRYRITPGSMLSGSGVDIVVGPIDLITLAFKAGELARVKEGIEGPVTRHYIFNAAGSGFEVGAGGAAYARWLLAQAKPSPEPEPESEPEPEPAEVEEPADDEPMEVPRTADEDGPDDEVANVGEAEEAEEAEEAAPPEPQTTTPSTPGVESERAASMVAAWGRTSAPDALRAFLRQPVDLSTVPAEMWPVSPNAPAPLTGHFVRTPTIRTVAALFGVEHVRPAEVLEAFGLPTHDDGDHLLDAGFYTILLGIAEEVHRCTTMGSGEVPTVGGLWQLRAPYLFLEAVTKHEAEAASIYETWLTRDYDLAEVGRPPNVVHWWSHEAQWLVWSVRTRVWQAMGAPKTTDNKGPFTGSRIEEIMGYGPRRYTPLDHLNRLRLPRQPIAVDREAQRILRERADGARSDTARLFLLRDLLPAPPRATDVSLTMADSTAKLVYCGNTVKVDLYQSTGKAAFAAMAEWCRVAARGIEAVQRVDPSVRWSETRWTLDLIDAMIKAPHGPLSCLRRNKPLADEDDE